MVDLVLENALDTAVCNRVEIPSDKRGNIVRGTGGWMRTADRVAGGVNEWMPAAGQLFVGIENVDDSRPVTGIQRRRGRVPLIGGFDGAI